MRVAVSLCVGLLAVGAASASPVPTDVQSKAAAMSDADAERNLARLLQPSEKAGGFCVYSEGKYAWKEANAAITGSRLSFQAPVVTKVDTRLDTGPTLGGRMTELVKKTEHFSLHKFTVELAQVDKIRFMDDDHGVSDCGQQPGHGKVVTLRAGHLVLEINVVNDDAEDLVSALLHFAPNARLVTGHGL